MNKNTGKMGVTCIECKSESCKYKCSTCYGPYCSSGCWKKHKERGECKRVKCINEEIPGKTVKQKNFVTEDTVSPENLSKLGGNNELKKMLRDPLVQKILLGVDSSPDPYDSVRKAMQDPCFVQFVDVCLKTVEEE